MPFKRPAPQHEPSSGYSSKSDPATPTVEVPLKRSKVDKSAKALLNIKLYIVQAKLDGPAVSELFHLAERHCGELCQDIDDANVVLTAITMRRRFERHVSWDVAKTKAIVTPSWLRDSVAEGKPLPCEGYVAFSDLRDETVKNCPTCDKRPCECDDTDYQEGSSSAHDGDYPSPPLSTASSVPIAAQAPSLRLGDGNGENDEGRRDGEYPVLSIPADLLPPTTPVATNLKRLSWRSNYACQRASPLVCPNQALAVELDIIRRSRALEGEERSTLSYARAISAIKACPHAITSHRQVKEIPFVGTKIANLVEEFIESGEISEARSISASERFRSLTLFSSIYGIGPNTARRLYALGLRTIEDLEIYYGVDPEEVQESQLVELEHKESDNGKRHPDTGLGESWIKIALGLRKDLDLKIPRDEVEEMGKVIMQELTAVEPGCVSTIVGGYRRGKPASNDVDIVITHPNPDKVMGLCKRFVRHLYSRGLVTHVMHLSSFHSHNPLKTTHWDSLEKALTVFILPPSSPHYHATRRRLDLIFALPGVYWTAVIGWSGSIMFQRDLRRWAEHRAVMKFDSSGIVRRYDSKEFFPKTEKEVFELLGLEWVDPTWRNADV